MSHLAVLGAAAVVLAAGTAATQGVAARDAGEGVVWVVTRGAVGPVLPQLLRGGDVRVVNAWGRGRLLQLHVGSLRGFELPRRTAWIWLRQPRSSPAWPGCG